ncbi:hypothetical protein B0H10DRAFT_1951493 [Mycena sp. CBHHK59/15]|nr:hypothetical protein B0H10DRAFT_1951493 [Mycena sp. CBHHK59/15]
MKSGSVCMLCAGKSVACTCCQSRKEKCEFVEIQRAGRTPKLNKGKARATTTSPSLDTNPNTNSSSAILVPATSLMHVVTRMEHVMGKMADWAMQEDIDFSIGLIPCLSQLSASSDPLMVDFPISNELREESFRPTLDNIFFDFGVLEDQWEDYLSQRLKLEEDLGVGNSRSKSDEMQEEMEVEDGLVTPADEESEF